MPKGAKKIPKDEPKDHKLVRLATARTNRIIKQINALGNLSRLKPNASQTEKVFDAIKIVAESAYGRWKGEKQEAQSFQM